jgi:hypothetical protein
MPFPPTFWGNSVHLVLEEHWETAPGNRGGVVPCRCMKPAECRHLKPTAASCIHDLFVLLGERGGIKKKTLGRFTQARERDASLALDPTSTEVQSTREAAAAT